MQILLFSDCHGETKLMEKAINAHPSVKLIINAGDSELPKSVFDSRFIYSVSGNCDTDPEYKDQLVINLNSQYAIYVTHGHLFDVYDEKFDLYKQAQSNSCNICVYGHTHRHLYEYDHGVHMINPGSITRPRNVEHPTYALLNIGVDYFDITFYNALNNEIMWDDII